MGINKKTWRTFCNIPILAENQPFQHILLGDFLCWWYVLIYCPFYTNTDIDMRFFVMRSWHSPVLFDMRHMIIRSMAADVSLFLSKGHYTVSACNCGEQTLSCRVLPLRNGHGIINKYPSLLYDASFWC